VGPWEQFVEKAYMVMYAVHQEIVHHQLPV
jgi:hypothetical protein